MNIRALGGGYAMLTVVCLLFPFSAASADRDRQTQDRPPGAGVDQADAEERAPEPRLRFEPVTVTAQKRPQDLQQTPVAVSVFDQAYLELAQVETIDTLAPQTPGLTIARFNAMQPQIYIRGIGSTDQSASGDPSVGVYIDGVYIPRVGAADLDFFDLARVEVLRGPQGTLYGKNVVGGAIHLITTPPSEVIGARAEVSFGNYRRNAFRGLLEGPLSDVLTGKITLSSTQRDGYATSALSGADLSDENARSARAQLLLAPNNDFELRLSIDNTRERLAGNNRECIGEQFVFFPWFAQGTPFAASPCSPDPFLNEKTVDGFQHRDIFGVAATATWHNRLGEFVSITAYRDAEIAFQEDFDGSDAPLVLRNVTDDSRQFSQELRISNDASAASWQWLLGYYYSNTHIDRLENNDFSGNDAPLGLPLGLSFNTFYFQKNKTENHAIFGQTSTALTDRTRLTMGGRLSYERKDANLRTTGFDPTGTFLAENYTVHPDDSWTVFTPSVALQHDLTPATMTYLAYSEGFKSGGFNGTARNATAALAGFNQERAKQLELGLKTNFWAQRARANLTLFYIDYTDLQVFQLIDGASLVVSNAADATSRGFEAELSAILSDTFTARASYAYLDAKYDTFIGETGEDYSGNTLTRAPKNSLSLGLTYSRALATLGTLTVHGEYSHRSRIFFEPNNIPLVGDDALGLLNLKASLHFARRWELSLWGRNLTDEVYVAQAIDGRGPFNLSQNAAATLGPPRMVGITLGYRR